MFCIFCIFCIFVFLVFFAFLHFLFFLFFCIFCIFCNLFFVHFYALCHYRVHPSRSINAGTCKRMSLAEAEEGGGAWSVGA